VFQTKDSPVLVEAACENNGKCTIDMRAYKGVFARTYARAALAAPIVAESISKTLSASAKGAANACTSGDDTECSLSWKHSDSSASAKDGNLGEVYNALEVVQGLLYSSVSKGLMSANSSGTTRANNTQKGGASNTSSTSAPQNTGAASSVAVNVMAILAVALVAALNC
jgi:mannan endo-1,6-alpha-mannosidase